MSEIESKPSSIRLNSVVWAMDESYFFAHISKQNSENPDDTSEVRLF